MALRWKQPIELNQQGKNAQGAYDASYAARLAAMRNPEASVAAMQDYVPNSAGYNTTAVQAQNAAAMMQGYNPTNTMFPALPPDQPRWGGTPTRYPEGTENYGEGALYEQRQKEAERRYVIQNRIDELETELASVTSKIAEIDKTTPGLARSPKEWEIAAKRAEIGDMSAYDNLMSRGNQASSSISNIESGLYAAAKEVWGMKDADDSQRNMSRNIIGVELQKAEDWARKNGVNIETGMPRIYYDLRQQYNALGGNGAPAPAGPASGSARLNFENARTVGNEVASLVAKKDLHDSDIKDMENWVAANPNSPHSSEIRTLIKDNKYKTVEAVERYNKKKAGSDALFNQAKDLSKDGLRTWWEGLTSEQRDLFKFKHSIDLSKGTVQ